jgi:hypothetical protein
MSFEADNKDFQDKTLMVLRDILDQLKMMNMILEDVHETGIKVDDIED